MATSSVEDLSDATEASRPELSGLLGSAKTTGAGQQQATFLAGEEKGDNIVRSRALRILRRNGRLLCIVIL